MSGLDWAVLVVTVLWSALWLIAFVATARSVFHIEK